MTDWLYTAETGLAVGTAVTAANSDDGTAGFAFDAVTVANGGTATYAAGLTGALAIRLTGQTSGMVARLDMTTLFSSSVLVWDIEQNMTAYPSAEARLIEVLNGGTFLFRMGIGTDGKVRAYNAAGALIWLSTTVLPLNTTFRIGTRITQGATTTTGTMVAAIYATKAATTAAETSATLTNVNLGTTAAPFNTMLLGKINSTPSWTTTVDNIQLSNTRTTLFGAPAVTSVTPPTAAATVTTGVAVADVTTSTPGNSGAISYGTPVRQSGATLTYTTITPGVFAFSQTTSSAVYRFPITEAGGGTGFVDKTIPAATATATAGQTRIRVKTGGVLV